MGVGKARAVEDGGGCGILEGRRNGLSKGGWGRGRVVRAKGLWRVRERGERDEGEGVWFSGRPG